MCFCNSCASTTWFIFKQCCCGLCTIFEWLWSQVVIHASNVFVQEDAAVETRRLSKDCYDVPPFEAVSLFPLLRTRKSLIQHCTPSPASPRSPSTQALSLHACSDLQQCPRSCSSLDQAVQKGLMFHLMHWTQLDGTDPRCTCHFSSCAPFLYCTHCEWWFPLSPSICTWPQQLF